MDCLHCLTRQITWDADPRPEDAKGPRPLVYEAETLSGGDALCPADLAASLPQAAPGTCGATDGDNTCTLPPGHEVYGYPADSYQAVRVHSDESTGEPWPE